MGIVGLECEAGCACEPRELDAHRVSATRNVSVVQSVAFVVSASPDCVLRFVVLDRSSSGGGHKWKLTQVAVTPIASAGGGGAVAADEDAS
eukprot:2869437-Prymnesium_polylepis.1